MSWWAVIVPGKDPDPSFSYLKLDCGFSGINGVKSSGHVSTILWWYDNLTSNHFNLQF
jgi:hypothetical protein